MEPATWVQFLDEAVCISFWTNALEKGINSFVLLLNMITQSADWISTEVLRLSQWVSWYDTKTSDSKAPILEIWRMWNNLSFLLISGLLWSGVIAPDRVLEQTVCKQMTDVKLWLLYSNTWNHLCAKKSTGLSSTKCLQIIYIHNIYVQRGFGIK